MTQQVILIVVVGFAALTSNQKESKMQVMDNLEGRWVAVRAEANGKPAHADLVEKCNMVFTGDKCVAQGPGGERQECRFKVDPSKTPKHIDFVVINEGPDKGDICLGIYSLDGDRLTLCLSDVETKRPSEFVTKKGSDTTLVVYQRDKPKPTGENKKKGTPN